MMEENTTTTTTATTTNDTENRPITSTSSSSTTLSRNAKFVIILGILLLLSSFRNEKAVERVLETTTANMSITRQKKEENSSTKSLLLPLHANRTSAEAKTTTTTTTTTTIETMINDDASPRPTTKLPKEPPEYYEKYPACQIRVYNMVEVHYEVMESIAKQIPYEYLNLVTTTNNNDNNNHKTKNAQCNPYHLNFEFDAKASGKVRAKSWLADMNDRVAGTSITDNLNVTRTLGPAYLGRSNNRTNWDVVIQVTCGCDAATRDWLITNNNNNHDNHNVCIHHGKCNWTDSIPNSIQMSPHFERYFVPSSLPIFDLDPAEQDKRDDRIDLCTIGSIWRRNWRLVTPFFENNDDDDSNSTTSTNYEQYYDKIRFRMLGKGGMPYPLRPYKNKTKFQPNQIGDDRKFYAAERACGVILLPIARIKGKNYVNYFKSPPDSTWKLSGTIPPIIAFERPFLVPNEILELYRKELPLHVPHRGFDDLEPNGFAEALSSLLDELLEMK